MDKKRVDAVERGDILLRQHRVQFTAASDRSGQGLGTTPPRKLP